MDTIKVFIPDSENVWLKAEVISHLSPTEIEVYVQNEISSARTLGNGRRKIIYSAGTFEESFPLQNSDDSYDDMVNMTYLHEPGILENLKVRFANNIPYTYVGNTCIAINPYQKLPLYSDQQKKDYTHFPRNELPPHVYATSSNAYRAIRDGRSNQSILVSGESGAGKTETVKILMRHLAFVAGNKKDANIDKMLQAHPLLESFGNAKTVRNDNSSRFGKFMQLQFNVRCRLVGSRCETYLLEKTRLVRQSSEERNYHIFYQLLSAPESIRQPLHLIGPHSLVSEFDYTCYGDCYTRAIEEVSDADHFQSTLSALQTVGLSQEAIQCLLRVLAGLLFLGRVRYIPQPGSDSDASQVAPDNSECGICCELLGLELKTFATRTTSRIIEAGGAAVAVPLTADQASDVRDALAKELYARLFHWLVRSINSCTLSEVQSSSPTTANNGHTHGQGNARNPQTPSSLRDQDKGDSGCYRTVGLLDIFGFESFETNRFEQLCINYANEKLQQKFTRDIFKAVQEEYQNEGLQWELIGFRDNNPVLELIEGRLGVIACLNEECVKPRGMDSAFLSKLRAAASSHNCFGFNLVKRDEFSIAHYAARVSYNVLGFVDRNRDALPNGITQLLATSNNTLLQALFQSDSMEGGSSPANSGKHPSLSSSTSPVTAHPYSLGGKSPSLSSLSTSPNAPSSVSSFMRAETVTTKFKAQLTNLMDTIESTDVQYVRCIKPNGVKSNSVFVKSMVVEQLRCAGLVEAIRISRAAYPNRMAFKDFLTWFGKLYSDIMTTPATATPSVSSSPNRSSKIISQENRERYQCGAILKRMLGIGTGGGAVKESVNTRELGFEVGRTRVYFSRGLLEKLEAKRNEVFHEYATRIQALARARNDRQSYRRLRKACRILQGCTRGRSLRRKLNTLKRNIVYLQYLVRRHQKYRRNRAAITIQCTVRCFIAFNHRWKLIEQAQKQREETSRNIAAAVAASHSSQPSGSRSGRSSPRRGSNQETDLMFSNPLFADKDRLQLPHPIQQSPPGSSASASNKSLPSPRAGSSYPSPASAADLAGSQYSSPNANHSSSTASRFYPNPSMFHSNAFTPSPTHPSNNQISHISPALNMDEIYPEDEEAPIVQDRYELDESKTKKSKSSPGDAGLIVAQYIPEFEAVMTSKDDELSRLRWDMVSLEVKYKDVKKNLDLAEDKVKALEGDRQFSEEKRHLEESEHRRLHAINDDFQMRMRRLENEVKDERVGHEKYIHQLQETLRDANARADLGMKELDQQRVVEIELRRQLLATEAQVQELQTENRRTMERLEQANKDLVSDYEASMAFLQATRVKMESRMEELVGEVEAVGELRRTLQLRREDIKQLRTEKMQLESELVDKRRELESQEELFVKRLLDAETATKTVNSEHEKVIRQKEDEASQLREQISQLQRQLLEEKEAADAARARLEDTLDNLVETNQQLEEQNNDLVEELAAIRESRDLSSDEQERRLSSIEQELREYRTEKQSLGLEMTNLLEEKRILEDHNATLRQTVHDLERENSKLKSEALKFELDVKSFEEERALLQLEIEQGRTEIGFVEELMRISLLEHGTKMQEEFEKEVDHLHNEIERLQHELQESQEAEEVQQAGREELEKTIEQLEELTTAQERQNEEQAKEISLIQEKLQRAVEDIDRVRSDKQASEKEASVLREDKRLLEEVISGLRSTVSLYQGAKDSAEEAKRDVTTGYEAAIAALKSALSESERSTQELRANSASLNAEKVAMSAELAELKKEAALTEELMRSSMLELEAKFEEETEELKGKLQLAQSEHELKLKLMQEDFHKHIEEHQREATAQMDQLRQDNKSVLDDKVTEFEEEKQRMVESSQQMKEDLLVVVNRLQESLLGKDKEISGLQHVLQRITEENAQLQSDIAEKVRDAAWTEELMKTAMLELESKMQTEINTALEEVQQLRTVERELSEKLVVRDEEISVAERALDEMQSMYAQQSEELEALHRDKSSFQQANEDLSKQQSELEIKQSLCEELKRHKEEYEYRLLQLESSSDKKSLEIESLQLKLSLDTTAKKALEEECARLQTQLRQHEYDLAATIDMIQSTREQSNLKLQVAEEEANKRFSVLEIQLKKDLEVERREVERLKQLEDSLRRELQLLQSVADSLKSQLQSVQSNISNAANMENEINRLTAALDDQLRTAQRDLSASQLVSKDLQREVEQLRADKQLLSREVANVQDEKKSLEDMLASLRQSLEINRIGRDVVSSYESMISSLKRSAQDAETKAAALKSENETARLTVETTLTELKACQRKIESLNSDKRAIEANVTKMADSFQRTEELQTALANAKEEITKLGTKLKNVEGELSRKKRELEIAEENSVNRSIEAKAAAEEGLKRVTKELETAREELRALRESESSLGKHFVESAAELCQLKMKYDLLLGQLDGTQSDYEAELMSTMDFLAGFQLRSGYAAYFEEELQNSRLQDGNPKVTVTGPVNSKPGKPTPATSSHKATSYRDISLSGHLAAFRKTFRICVEDLDRASRDTATLEAQLTATRRELEGSSDSSKDLSSRLAVENQAHEAALRIKTEEVETLKSKLVLLQASEEAAREGESEARLKLDLLQTSFDELNREMDSVLADSDTVIVEQRDELKRLHEENARLTNEKLALEVDNLTRAREVERLRINNSELSSDHEATLLLLQQARSQMDANLSRVLQDLETVRGDSERVISSLRAELKDRDQTIDTLRRDKAGEEVTGLGLSSVVSPGSRCQLSLPPRSPPLSQGEASQLRLQVEQYRESCRNAEAAVRVMEDRLLQMDSEQKTTERLLILLADLADEDEHMDYEVERTERFRKLSRFLRKLIQKEDFTSEIHALPPDGAVAATDGSIDNSRGKGVGRYRSLSRGKSALQMRLSRDRDGYEDGSATLTLSSRYVKLLKVLSLAAVRQKMLEEGQSPDALDAFLTQVDSQEGEKGEAKVRIVSPQHGLDTSGGLPSPPYTPSRQKPSWSIYANGLKGVNGVPESPEKSNSSASGIDFSMDSSRHVLNSSVSPLDDTIDAFLANRGAGRGNSTLVPIKPPPFPDIPALSTPENASTFSSVSSFPSSIRSSLQESSFQDSQEAENRKNFVNQNLSHTSPPFNPYNPTTNTTENKTNGKATSPSNMDIATVFAKYDPLRRMLPEKEVRRTMISEGVPKLTVDAFFAAVHTSSRQK